MQASSPCATPTRRFAIGVFDSRDEARAFCAAFVEDGTDKASVGIVGADHEPATAAPIAGPFRILAMARAASAERLAVLERWLLPVHARYLSDALEAGRVLVWVETSSFDQECRICLNMLKSSGRMVQIHDFNT